MNNLSLQRPSDPQFAYAPKPSEGAANEGAPGKRKVSVSDKGMEGDEIKVTIESTEEKDPRVSFLLNAFTRRATEDTPNQENVT